MSVLNKKMIVGIKKVNFYTTQEEASRMGSFGPALVDGQQCYYALGTGETPETGEEYKTAMRAIKDGVTYYVLTQSGEIQVEYEWTYKFIAPNGASQINNFASKLGVNPFDEDEFFGPYDDEVEDYDYSQRKVEIYYLGSTLQEVSDLNTTIDESQIKKTNIIDMYGELGLLVPYTSQDDELKAEFTSNVEAATESSVTSIDYDPDSDTLYFEDITHANQIFLIRKKL